MNILERSVLALAGRAGLTVARTSSLQARLPIEASTADRAIIASVRQYTMTSSERLWSLLQAVSYVSREGVPGDLVECGVWRGGSIMAIALRLKELGVTDRQIWLYDTFEGMTEPTAFDVEADTGRNASDLLDTTAVGDGNNVWAKSSIDSVQDNVASTGYPMNRMTFVAGDVATTLRQEVPSQISLLRIDTDWYESTKTSMEVLYPRLSLGGVCILDDYGHWAGARQAVDEFFAASDSRPLMHPIDYSGRIFIKTR
jgi:hypothetical protein